MKNEGYFPTATAPLEQYYYCYQYYYHYHCGIFHENILYIVPMYYYYYICPIHNPTYMQYNIQQPLLVSLATKRYFCC